MHGPYFLVSSQCLVWISAHGRCYQLSMSEGAGEPSTYMLVGQGMERLVWTVSIRKESPENVGLE